MEGVFVGEKPLSEVVEEVAEKTDKKPKKQKFVQIHGHQEIHITGCAVSRLPMIHQFPELPEPEYQNYFVVMNKDYKEWLTEYKKNLALTEAERKEFVPLPERAWVKVYRWINPDVDSITKGRVQTLTIEMPFLGESVDECWAEVQINTKRTIVRFGKKIDLELIKFGRHKSFNSLIGQWVEETKPIEPKIKKDDDGNQRPSPHSHYYITLRLFHQGHLPIDQQDWYFEPLYVSVADEDFYRINAIWPDQKIIITNTLLDDDSDEIPKFLR